MNTGKFIDSAVIRAAAFWRLVKCINDEFLPLTPDYKGSSVLMAIKSEKYAPPIFTADNLDDLVAAMIIVMRCYSEHPEIYEKFNNMYLSTLARSLITGNKKMIEAEKRAREIKELNCFMYELSKQTDNVAISASAKIVKCDGHEFHPDSEFIEFSVRTKEQMFRCF